MPIFNSRSKDIKYRFHSRCHGDCYDWPHQSQATGDPRFSPRALIKQYTIIFLPLLMIDEHKSSYLFHFLYYYLTQNKKAPERLFSSLEAQLLNTGPFHDVMTAVRCSSTSSLSSHTQKIRAIASLFFLIEAKTNNKYIQIPPRRRDNAHTQMHQPAFSPHS